MNLKLQARQRLLAGNAMLAKISEFSVEEIGRYTTMINAALTWLGQQGEGTKQIGKVVTAGAEDLRPAIEAFHWLARFAPDTVEGFNEVYAVHDMVDQVQIGRQLEITPSAPLLAFSAEPVIDMLDRELNHTKDILIRLHDPLVIFSWTTFDGIDLPGAAQTIPKIDPMIVALKKLKARCELLKPDKIVLVLVGKRPFKVDVSPPHQEQEGDAT